MTPAPQPEYDESDIDPLCERKTPAPQQQPKEYIITEDELQELSDIRNPIEEFSIRQLNIISNTRSRPHPAPAQHEGYTGTCAMQSKCSEYADFCESIMDEITENEDEDPPCPIKCDKRVNPNQADCTEAARQAREDVLEELLEWSNLYCSHVGGGQKSPYMLISGNGWKYDLVHKIESLRSTQHPGQERS